MNGNVRIRYPLMILYCVALHFLWGAMLLVDASGGKITTLYDLSNIFGYALPYILISVGILALVPILFSLSGLISIFLVIPQQIILMSSAITAINAMVCGCFADGIVRSHVFLMADQGTFLMAAIFHTIAIVGSYIKIPI